jgi:hypothetical protein
MAQGQPTARAALPVNPHLSALQQAGGRTPAHLFGWIGDGAPAGKSRLHVHINQPGYYVEFSNADVVHSADLSESVLPFGAKAVWLKPDARVRLYRSLGTSAMQASRFLSGVNTPSLASFWMLHPSLQSQNSAGGAS